MAPVKVNVFAQDRGWLFEDLKEHFRRLDLDGITAVVSEAPHRHVDAWVALRTREAHASPDPGRTAVCVHDLFDEPGLYAPGGDRRGVHRVGGLVLCHPDQRRILEAAGVRLDRAKVLERPIGALSSFSLGDSRGARFTIGWVGRNHWRKRLNWFVEVTSMLAGNCSPFDVVLIGAGLEEAAANLQRCGIEVRVYPRDRYTIAEYPRLYRELDLLVITSMTEAGPLPLFEALASGLSVVSTPVGWAPWFAERAPPFVRLANTPAEIGGQIEQVRAARDALFRDRHEVAALARAWSLEGWLRDVARLAADLAGGATDRS
jgi:glycosyltransferase involved in cell wall biosynthesis